MLTLSQFQNLTLAFSHSAAMPLSDLWDDYDLDEQQQNDGDQDEAVHSAPVRGMKRRLQTSAARVALAGKRASASSRKPPDTEPSYAHRLQESFFTQQYQRGHHMQHSRNPHSASFTDRKQQFGRERARCVLSLLKCMLQTIRNLFSRPVVHTVNSIIADDTSTKMKCASSDRAVVYTVMNAVENLTVRYDAVEWECQHLPTPVACLESSKGGMLHAAFTSWLVTSLSGLGSHWERLGLHAHDLGSKWRTCILVGDALKANDSAWRLECKLLTQARQDPNSPSHRSLGIRIKCSVHQLALIRKPAVLSIDHYWTTLVRLGHLFETYSFRRALGAAVVSLMQREGQFIRTFDLTLVPLFAFHFL